MDIHIFDGKLKESKESLLPYLKLISEVSREDKLIAFERLKNKINPSVNLDIIIRDSNSPANHDLTNDLHAEDLLYLCVLLVDRLPDNETLINTINQQFDEMSTGFCAQGRTHRLFQVIMAFIEFL
jgi:hypothetical protein